MLINKILKAQKAILLIGLRLYLRLLYLMLTGFVYNPSFNGLEYIFADLVFKYILKYYNLPKIWDN